MKSNSFFLCQFTFVLGLAALRFSFCVGNVHSENVEAWAHNIGAKIHNFAVHATGSVAVEKELEKLSFTTRANNGTRMKIVAKTEEVQETYEYDANIEPFSYLDTKDQVSLASHNLRYNTVFLMNVTYELSGIHVPTDIYDKAPEILNTIKWTEELDEVFINNTKDDPDLKWQYFGSQTGVFRSYPGAKFDVGPKGIDLYDVRKRPWYIHGSTSPKSVVIIVDSSGSMFGRPLLIARIAVAELIDTLSENDFFNLIWFNIDVHYLACENKFVQATSQNREYYKSKLRDIQASYVASWPKAYEAAFKLFIQDDGAVCQKVITVFTDGPTERAEGVFETYNSDKKVHVFTYAVGPPAHSIEALRSIACDNRGFFYRIPGVGSVRDVVKGYVSVLSRPMAEKNEHDPVWSSVYVDSGRLGMMITGTLPAFVRTNKTGGPEILGVVGTDVTLKDIDLLFDLTSIGDDGYLFLISNNGHVIKHPGFEAHLGYLPDPPDVYISDIEYSWDVNSTKPMKLREKMLKTKQNEVGTMTFDVALFSRDEFSLRVKKRNMNYYFTTVDDTPIWAGIAFPSTYVEIVPGDPSSSETVVNFLLDYWKSNTFPSEDDVETFVKIYNGSFNISKSDSTFTPEKGIVGRVDEYPNDITVLTVPYNSGKENAEDVKITGYRKMTTNASGTFVNVGVVGFNMNHSQFQQVYFINASIQGIDQFCNATVDEVDGYYCYLLDENAFVVAASVHPEKVTGQFFGNVNGKVMEQLTTGGNTVIYERMVRTDPQGSCVDPSAGSASSAPFLQPFLSGTSYIKWCFAKAIWFVANLNVYNWLYGKPVAVSAETTEIEKPTNRSCIMEITAYYSEVNNENTTQEGQANCGSNCNSNACRRSFVISKVPKTNLYLVVVDGLCPSSELGFTGVPGVPQEVIRNESEQEEAVCSKDPYREGISRCVTDINPETNYPCGRSSVVSVSLFLLILILLSSFCNL